MLAPLRESANPAKYRGYQTESDGTFSYPLIPPGDYYLFALEDSAFEYANPDAVRPWLAKAQKITVTANQSLTGQRVSLTAKQ